MVLEITIFCRLVQVERLSHLRVCQGTAKSFLWICVLKSRSSYSVHFWCILVVKVISHLALCSSFRHSPYSEIQQLMELYLLGTDSLSQMHLSLLLDLPSLPEYNYIFRCVSDNQTEVFFSHFGKLDGNGSWGVTLQS